MAQPNNLTNMKQLRSARGFTLLEIIVVVAIIAILAAYIAPKVAGRVDDAMRASHVARALIAREDPASAPGVQTPEAGGPSARETLNFVRALSGLSVAGADVVETNPLYDGPGQITALLAATVAAEFLALIAEERLSGA